MARTPYFFMMNQGTGVSVRSLLNDIPFCKGDGQENVTVSGPANHLLVPGKNTFSIEVKDAPRPAHAPFLAGVLRFTLKLDEDVESVVHHIAWPELWETPLTHGGGVMPTPPGPRDDGKVEATPFAERELPFVHTSTFLVDPANEKPCYWENRPEDFGPEGTPEQHEAVRHVYRAFLSGNADEFLSVHALKLEERQRAYPDVIEFSAAHQRQRIADQMSRQWEVRPVDLDHFEDLTFESRAGGRVVHVTRPDGWALEAIGAKDPSETFRTDLSMTRKDGVWRVFR